AVGRPSNSGGVELLRELNTDKPIIIVGENDPRASKASRGEIEWPGKAGAESVAAQLSKHLDRPVPSALPPADAKDVRDWLTTAARGGIPWPDRGQELARLLATGASAVSAICAWPAPVPLDAAPVVPPYPVDVLPDSLREWAEAVAVELQMPVDLPAALGFGLVAAGIA